MTLEMMARQAVDVLGPLGVTKGSASAGCEPQTPSVTAGR